MSSFIYIGVLCVCVCRTYLVVAFWQNVWVIVSGLAYLKMLHSHLLDSLDIEFLTEKFSSLEFLKCCLIDFNLAVLEWRIQAPFSCSFICDLFSLENISGLLMCQYFSSFTFSLFSIFSGIIASQMLNFLF